MEALNLSEENEGELLNQSFFVDNELLDSNWYHFKINQALRLASSILMVLTACLHIVNYRDEFKNNQINFVSPVNNSK